MKCLFVRSIMDNISSLRRIAQKGEGDKVDKYSQNKPSLFRLREFLSPMMMWSNTSIPTISPALANLLVSLTSSSEASGSPEGWLWTKMEESIAT